MAFICASDHLRIAPLCLRASVVKYIRLMHLENYAPANGSPVRASKRTSSMPSQANSMSVFRCLILFEPMSRSTDPNQFREILSYYLAGLEDGAVKPS